MLEGVGNLVRDHNGDRDRTTNIINLPFPQSRTASFSSTMRNFPYLQEEDFNCRRAILSTSLDLSFFARLRFKLCLRTYMC